MHHRLRYYKNICTQLWLPECLFNWWIHLLYTKMILVQFIYNWFPKKDGVTIWSPRDSILSLSIAHRALHETQWTDDSHCPSSWLKNNSALRIFTVLSLGQKQQMGRKSHCFIDTNCRYHDRMPIREITICVLDATESFKLHVWP